MKTKLDCVSSCRVEQGGIKERRESTQKEVSFGCTARLNRSFDIDVCAAGLQLGLKLLPLAVIRAVLRDNAVIAATESAIPNRIVTEIANGVVKYRTFNAGSWVRAARGAGTPSHLGGLRPRGDGEFECKFERASIRQAGESTSISFESTSTGVWISTWPVGRSPKELVFKT